MKTGCVTISLWWCFLSPMTIMKVVAFMRSDLSTTVLRQEGLSQARSVIRNDDFERIFGKQEAAERRIRDLAREYHPLRKVAIDKKLFTTHAAKENAEKGNDKQQLQIGAADKNTYEFAPICNETKLKKKYVPIYEH